MRRLALAVVMLVALTTPMLAQDAVPAFSEGVAAVKITQLASSTNQRFLVDAAGQPFFWFGDTVWPLVYRPSRTEISMYLDDRASRGFNVIQFTGVPAIDVPWNSPNAEGNRPFTNGLNPNEAYWSFVDWVVDEIGARGMRAAIVPMWRDSILAGRFTDSNASAYGQFIGQRYASKPHVVILNGGDLIAVAGSNDKRPLLRNFAAGIEANAPNAAMSFHPGGGLGSWYWIGKDSWLDAHMFQSGQGVDQSGICKPRAYGMARLGYARDWAAGTSTTFPPKPIIDGEPIYEGFPRCFNLAAFGRSTAKDIRREAYHSVFAGGIGWTYGNNNSRQFQSRTAGRWQTADWQDSLDSPAIAHLRILKSLIESFDVLSRVPDQSLIVTAHSGKRRIVGTRGNDYALVYTPDGDSFTVRMGKISGASVHAAWLNPRTGVRQAIGTFNNSGTRAFNPPSALDWALIFEAV